MLGKGIVTPQNSDMMMSMNGLKSAAMKMLGAEGGGQRMAGMRHDGQHTKSSESLAERDREQLRDEDDEELVAGAVRRRLEASGVREEEEERDRAEDRVRALGEELAEREHPGRVHLRRVLPDERRAREDVRRLDLREDERRDDRRDEDDEDAVLERRRAVTELEEREAGEERDDDVREQAAERSAHDITLCVPQRRTE
jgi:hypothetical protein